MKFGEDFKNEQFEGRKNFENDDVPSDQESLVPRVQTIEVDLTPDELRVVSLVREKVEQAKEKMTADEEDGYQHLLKMFSDEIIETLGADVAKGVMLYHVLIGSTPKSGMIERLDFEGDFSVIQFLHERGIDI